MPANSNGLRAPCAVLTRIVRVAVLGGSLLIPGCAPAARTELPSPAEIPSLESQLRAEPTSLAILVRLGVAYREAGRLDAALPTLERAIAQNPSDPAAVFYLGLTYEDVQRPGAARELYTRYLQIGGRSDLKRMLAARLPLLRREELLLEVREAIAREADIADAAPQPRTVGVFPFVYTGDNPEYRPLGRALSEMLVTDLSQTDRLTVLERGRIQLLLDELRLTEGELVDTLSAARPGRLLGAERIVQGRLDVEGASLSLHAAVVATATGSLESRPLVERAALQELFSTQKRLALGLYASMGIQLTAAERERITQNPTENLQALLAYGQCLEAGDEARFADAAAFCAQAAELDPAFSAARQLGAQAAEAASAATVPPEQIAILGLPEVETVSTAISAAQGDVLDALQVLLPQELPRAPIQEVLGTSAGGLTTTIEILIERP